MALAGISAALQGMVGLAAALLFLGAVSLAYFSVRRRWAVGVAVSIAALIPAYILCQMAIYTPNSPSHDGPQAAFAYFGDLPVDVPIFALVAVAALEALAFVLGVRRRRSHIDASSVKEAVDSLPDGICVFEDSGKVVLRNTVAERVCWQASGVSLANGRRFSDTLRFIEEDTADESAGGAFVELADGTVWTVSRERIEYDGRELTVLTIADVTEERRKTEVLRRKQRCADLLTEQLEGYGRQIEELVAAREMLAAKVRLHDEVGANLLAIERYLTAGGTRGGTRADLARIRSALLDGLDFLAAEAHAPAADEIAVIVKTAEALGVAVHVDGELPSTSHERHILGCALHECLTNAIRHAHGKELFVTIEQRSSTLQATFTNDGIRPQGPIAEGGGLTSLRFLAEGAGGTMSISWKSGFSLTINLPVKEESHAI